MSYYPDSKYPAPAPSPSTFSSGVHAQYYPTAPPASFSPGVHGAQHYSTPSPATSSSGAQADLLISTLLPEDQSPPPYQSGGLPLPLCIPQNADASFVRGYNQTLHEAVGIPQAQFLSFVDGLNVAITASPPLRVVDKSNMGIGFMPYHWEWVAGAAMQTTTQWQGPMRVLPKTVSDRYLRAANLRLFKPRGLSVRLCTTTAMLQLVANGQNGASSPPISNVQMLAKAGKIGGLVLGVPFSGLIINTLVGVSQSATSGSGNGVSDPRLKLVEGYTLPLDLNVPPPYKAQEVTQTLRSWGVQFNQFADRRRGLQTVPQMSMQSLGSRRDRKDDRRDARKEEKRAEKAQKEARKQERGGLLSSLLTHQTASDRRGANSYSNAYSATPPATEQFLWIVLMPSRKDQEIVNIDIAESWSDEELVDESTWQAQLGYPPGLYNNNQSRQGYY